MFINSLNAARAIPVLETLFQQHSFGMDLLQILVDMAKIGDQVNADIRNGEPSSSTCYCEEAQSGSVLHACEGCDSPAICDSKKLDRLGRLVCRMYIPL